MAVGEPHVDIPVITRPMTYEEDISGPEEMARYDILDGWKVYRLYGDNLLLSPTRRHQNIALNLAEAFRGFQRASRQGQAIIAPCDVQITYQPLRSRQPDLLFYQPRTPGAERALRSVEVVQLSAEQADIANIYSDGEAAVSQVFPGLVVPVSSIFSQE